MKLLNAIICLLMVTGIVACNKKKGGGGQQPQPIPYNHYGQNDLYQGPGPQEPNHPGTIPQIPGCMTPPPMFTDLYQECAWLAVTTDCDQNIVNQVFINKCYGLNLERPGCVFPSQPVLVSCGSRCDSYDDDYEPRRRRRSYDREERVVVRRESVSTRPVSTRSIETRSNDPIVVREPIERRSTQVREVVVHSQPSPARVVIADRTTGPDNGKDLPRECKGNVVKDCRYKRPIDGLRGSLERSGVRAKKIIASDLSVERNQSQDQSKFYREVEKGNVECKHSSTGNRYELSYFEYAKAIDTACFGSQEEQTVVVERPVAIPRAEEPVVEQPIAPAPAAPKYDSSKCQWIVDLHNMLDSTNQGISSFSRVYTSQPLADTKDVSDADLKTILNQITHGGNITVIPGRVGSAFGHKVAIDDNVLIVGNSEELIKVCEEKKIVTQFRSDNHWVTREYIWDGLKSEDGEVDVRTTVNYNAYADSGVKLDAVTSRLVIWKSGLTEDQIGKEKRRYNSKAAKEGYVIVTYDTDFIKREFEQDQRITQRSSSRDNSLDLSRRTNGK